MVPYRLVACLLSASCWIWPSAAWARLPQPNTAAPAHRAPALPAAVTRLLAEAQLPPESLTVVVRDVQTGRDLLRHQAERPVNPASIIKLVTTYAALDQFGPTWTWRTPVWLAGRITDPGPQGVLEGSLHIRGVGDPKLVPERVWALLQRVQQAGVREIRGDIVLDQSAFTPSDTQAADFDGEPLRPYNVLPRALMLNQRTVTYHFVPDAAAGVARVVAEPELTGVTVQPTLPLETGPCRDWRQDVQARWTDPLKVRWEGRYATACGARSWPVAYPEPERYDGRILSAMWSSMGGRLTGRVIEGPAPSSTPSFEWASPPLAEVIRDINRFSNNTMAQMLALSLAAADTTTAGSIRNTGTVDAAQARDWLQQWMERRLGNPTLAAGLRIDNGSGLSRSQRITGDQLAALLMEAWRSPVMPELIASLPVTGIGDGTLSRWRAAPGRAHLKTGSLKDVFGIAGFVVDREGRRRIVVAIVNHERALSARPALDALVSWAADAGHTLR